MDMSDVITKGKAIDIMRKKFPKKVVRSCDEYSNGYIVDVVPKGMERSNDHFLDSAWFVAKDGSLVVVYMPGMVPENELKKESPVDVIKRLSIRHSISIGKEYLAHTMFE